MPYNSDAEARLLAQLRAKINRGAANAADQLKGDLSRAGSGIHWPGNPNRSSAPGEYPARQTGELADSIGWRPAGPLLAEVGALNNPPAWAAYLEFQPVSTREPGSGIRAWATKASLDPAFQAAFLRGVLES